MAREYTGFEFENPFTPSSIASEPEAFYGRHRELRKLERAFRQGSICIQGSMGIGKSSLLSHLLLLMEGFDSNHNSKTVNVTAHSEIDNIDDAARLLLEEFVSADEENRCLKVSLLKVVNLESSETYKNFCEGRHLAVLSRILKRDFLKSHLNDQEYLIIAIDEADKCPKLLAKLIRVLSNSLQQTGVNNVRFVLAGVYPFFKQMVDQDQGISRLFAQRCHLTVMPEHESEELLVAKFDKCKEDALKIGQEIYIDLDTIDVIKRLSGGHPHLLQLLGYHLVENELDDPDGIMNVKDLFRSLQSICYEDRSDYYDSMLHLLEVHGYDRKFVALMNLAASGFPTYLENDALKTLFSADDVQWLYNNNFITRVDSRGYGLIDEFLRVRIAMDENASILDEVEMDILAQETARDTGVGSERDILDFSDDDDLDGGVYYDEHDRDDD